MWLKNIGKNAIVYVCMNQFVIICINQVFLTLSYGNIIFKVIIKVMTIVIVLISLYLLEKIFTKTKIRVVIGKK